MSDALYYTGTNIFFEGKVVLRNFLANDARVTFGFMAVGEYRWLAEETERFNIETGTATFSYDGNSISAGADSEILIPPGTIFKVVVTECLDYRCYYA